MQNPHPFSFEEHIKGLEALGLSKTQAKTYFALLQLGTSTVRQVAVASKVDRPDAYRATVDLLELGLVSKVVSSPIRYEPLPFSDAIRVLYIRKLDENTNAYNALAELEKMLARKSLVCGSTQNNQFVLIPQGASDLKLKKLLDGAKKSILIVTPKKRALRWMLENCEGMIANLRKNVSHKIIIASMEVNDVPEEIKKFMGYGSFQLRCLRSPSAVWFRLCDSEELILQTSAETEKSSPVMWSSNKCLIAMAEAYFDLIWAKAKNI